MEQYTGKIIIIQYIQGGSEIVTGVKSKDQRKIDNSNLLISGGNGTNRMKIPATLEAFVKIKEAQPCKVDIKNFIKTSLNFKKFTKNRVEILKRKIPEYELEFIYENGNYKVDPKGQNVNLWIEELKLAF